MEIVKFLVYYLVDTIAKKQITNAIFKTVIQFIKKSKPIS